MRLAADKRWHRQRPMYPFPAKAADIVIVLYPAIGTVTTFCAVSTSFAGRNAGNTAIRTKTGGYGLDSECRKHEGGGTFSVLGRPV